MMLSDLSTSNSDEIFIMAKKLIVTRSRYLPYFPTEDIFRLRECIIGFTYLALMMCIRFKSFSLVIRHGTGLLKYPAMYFLIKLMLKEIDMIVFGQTNDYSCSISKKTCKDILMIIEDRVGETIDGYLDKIGSIGIKADKKSSDEKKKYYHFNELELKLMDASTASYMMVFGWMYMHVLYKKINNYGGLDLRLDDNIFEIFKSEFDSNKESIKRVKKLAHETIKGPYADSTYYDGKHFDIEKFIQHFIASVDEEIILQYNLEREEHSKIIGKAFLSSSFEKSVITKEIASFTTHILLTGNTITNAIQSYFTDSNKFCAFKGSWNSMVSRSLKRLSNAPADSLENIKSRYCNYLTCKLDIPEYIWMDYGDYSNNLLYPNVQGANSFVNILYVVFDIEQREPQRSEASVLFLVWSFMFAEIFKKYAIRMDECEVNDAVSFIIAVLLRLMAPVGRSVSECFYSKEAMRGVYYECKKNMPHIEDVLDYLPEHFGVLKTVVYDDTMWTKCVKDVITRKMADLYDQILSKTCGVDNAAHVICDAHLSDIFIDYLKPLYKKIY